MKHIVKVNNIQDAKDNPTRLLIAMDSNGILFAEGKAAVPDGNPKSTKPFGTGPLENKTPLLSIAINGLIRLSLAF